MHYRFLRELHVTPEHAFLEYAFAPPSLRRNIGILGLLHKRVLGKCHPSFASLLPFWTDQPEEIRARGHTRKLYGHSTEVKFQRPIYDSSIFEMVDIYNNLLQQVVDGTSVNSFQHYLIHIVRTRCQSEETRWAKSFCACSGLD